LAEGAEGVGVFALQAGFTRLGFDLPPSGKFDAATKAVVVAFQQHWRQDKVDGIADGQTRAQLMALLRLAG
jgi:N-acetylmuramoyl-L-alanine amidase